MKITNLKETREHLADILMRFDKELAPWYTDVYLYINPDNTARVCAFVSYNGIIFLNDNHIVIYTDAPHCEDRMDIWGHEIAPFAKILNIPCDELEDMVRKYCGRAEVTYNDFRCYVKEENKGLYEKIINEYNIMIKENRNHYEQYAEEILSKFIDDDGTVTYIR